MEKAELLESLKTLVAQEDALAISREVNDLHIHFEDLMLEEDRLRQIAEMDAAEKGEALEERPIDSIREEFKVLYSEFRDRKNALQRSKKETEEANLRRKKMLIERLKQTVENEENIGAAMQTYKEIHDEWKTIGDVPREKRQDIQSDYSKLLETFFYHIKIYRELRDHDFHRNQQLKEEIIQRIDDLSKIEKIKDLEASIRSLQNDWDEIGPVPNEAWETLKSTYWEKVKAVFVRIHEFYEGKRSELAENLIKKKELAQKTAGFVAQIQADTNKAWDDATKELILLQEEWKNIGFANRKESEEIWKEFRASCDAFFAKKKEFFDESRKEFSEVAAKKQKLIDRIHEIKESTDWKRTTDQILNLQKEWKNLGNAGHRFEQKLWKEFRAACDEFFNAKQAFFNEKDQELIGNLDLKKALIDELKSIDIPADKNEALAILRDFAKRFNEIGHVPMKEKDSVYNAYKQALDAHYNKLKLEGEEKDKAMFQARLDTIKANPNADKLIGKEKHDIHDKINKLKAEILQYENNLGFFAKSKGADALRKEVESKINHAKNKIEELKTKLKML